MQRPSADKVLKTAKATHSKHRDLVVNEHTSAEATTYVSTCLQSFTTNPEGRRNRMLPQNTTK
jgi:hypothetical protein